MVKFWPESLMCMCVLCISKRQGVKTKKYSILLHVRINIESTLDLYAKHPKWIWCRTFETLGFVTHGNESSDSQNYVYESSDSHSYPNPPHYPPSYGHNSMPYGHNPTYPYPQSIQQAEQQRQDGNIPLTSYVFSIRMG